MRNFKLVLPALLLAFGACTPSQYVVSDIYRQDGAFVVQKCAIDYRGRTTTDCHTEPMADRTTVNAELTAATPATE